MLGIGIDYAIQMHSRIEEEVDHRRRRPTRSRRRRAASAPPCWWSPSTPCSPSSPSSCHRFRWSASSAGCSTVGIIAICISSIINPLAILGIREYRSPTKGKDFSEGRLGRFVVWLGKLPPSTAIAHRRGVRRDLRRRQLAGAVAQARVRPGQLGQPELPRGQGHPRAPERVRAGVGDGPVRRHDRRAQPVRPTDGRLRRHVLARH